MTLGESRLVEEGPHLSVPLGVGRTIAALSLLLLLWSALAQTDVVAMAAGQLRPIDAVRFVQSAEAGTVLSLSVQEGDTVTAGQVLFVLDGQSAAVDLLAAQRALSANLALAGELMRLRSPDPLGQRMEAMPNDVPEAIWRDSQRRAMGEVRARVAAHQDLQREAQARIQQAEAEWQSAFRDERRLAGLAKEGQAQLMSYTKLHDEGFISPMSMAERQRDQAARQEELEAQRARVHALQASLEAARARMAAVNTEFQAGVAEDLRGLRAQEPGLVQSLAHARTRQGRLEVVAPMAGTVKDLIINGPGQVLAAGVTALTIVPSDGSLKAEVWLDHGDVGLVKVGQAVRVKLAAFPFQRYGWLAGQVTQLAPDVYRAQADGGEQGFRAQVRLAPPDLAADQRPLKPGMAVQAEIVLDRRSLLAYLLSPVLAAGHDAGQEP